MTHFTDGLRIGAAGTGTDSRGIPDQAGVQTPQLGVPTSQSYIYDVVPATIVANNIAAAQTASGAPATLTLSAGTSASVVTLRNGVSAIALDCARAVTISSVATVTAISFTINGYDDYQQAMTQTLTGPGSAATVTTTKAFRYITSITCSGNTTSNITVGTSDVLGLPVRADAFEYLTVHYNSGLITLQTGFTAAVTSTATATTGDVRGTYALQTASNGVRRFCTMIFIKNPDTVAGTFGVTQF